MRRGSPYLKTYSQKSSNGDPSKRVRISEGTNHGERAPRGDGRSTFKGVQVSSEPLSKVQEIGLEVEHLKKRLEERKINHKLLWSKFIDLGVLLKRAESRRK